MQKDKSDNDLELVSVIIPVYNSEKVIEEAIKSVLQQTYSNIEIIVIDDASSDGTEEIIKNMRQNNSNIFYKKLDTNSGVAVARNTGMYLAKGKYIAFLDSDDIWKPEKIKKQIDLLKFTNGNFAFSAIEIINEDGEIIKEKRHINTHLTYKKLLKNTMISTSTVLIDIEKTEKFYMPELRKGEDYITWLKLLKNNNIAYGVDEALVQYRRMPGSLSSSKLKNIKDVWNAQVKYEKICPVIVAFNCCCYVFNAIKKHLF